MIGIREQTGYPFTESIRFTVFGREPALFPLHLRIPGWCRAPRVTLNGRTLTRELRPGSFCTIRRTFAPGDEVLLELPMETTVARWPRGTVSVERGPLAYSLAIAEDWAIDAEEPARAFPSYALRAASPWNYALAVHERSPARDLELERRPVTDHPWSLERAPVTLHVPARRVRGWRIRTLAEVVAEQWVGDDRVPVRLRGSFRFTPQVPADPAGRLSGRLERVRLVPYGCTHLRVTLFPSAAAP